MEDSIKLEYEPKNGWTCLDEEGLSELEAFCEDYKKFLDSAKTEREASDTLVSEAEKAGFVNIKDYISRNEKALPGTKLYAVNRGKSCAFIVIGKADPVLGMNMVGAHIDAPRMDLKPRPIYEDSGFALAKTHYYGGIKKYQWVAMPLALHGVVLLEGGTKLNVCIGEDDGDPVMYITDLLPHLAQEQMVKNGYGLISGEMLNLTLGSKPGIDPAANNASEDAKQEEAEGAEENKDEKKEAPDKSVKKAVLKILYDKYGIKESDFFRAEFEVVPAAKARDVGLDRSLIGSYGQDDRVCAYTGFRALLDLKEIPEKTAVVYLSDKEEIGSIGNTGARSCWLENLCLELVSNYDAGNGMLALRRAMANTKFLSADVTAAFDPNFPEVSDKHNVAFAGNGISFNKYTGGGGKSGSSDASAEFVAYVIDTLEKKSVPWQLTEMGRVDLGGGGTIAQFMADLGMDVLDCGVPVLSMHSPYEVTSKADVYWTYKAYMAFIGT
ncbi:MAG: aminopeptidase [Clostridia bacterium]|nr:aminopeptidase [Clostridia bacterium]